MIDLSGYDVPAPGDVEYQNVPTGTYLSHIAHAAEATAKSGTQQLMLHLVVKHHGAKVPVRTYIAHTGPKGERIPYGRKRIFDLAVACGIGFPEAPAQEQHKPKLDASALIKGNCEVALKLVEDSGFSPKNDLETAYPARKDATGAFIDPQAAAAAAAAPAADSAGLPPDFGAGGPAAAASPPAGF